MRILECYVLSAIGELSPQQEATLTDLLPALNRAYGREGTWQSIVAAEMRFSDRLPTSIQQMWLRNQEIAKRAGVTLSAQQFAEMFVDENLVA